MKYFFALLFLTSLLYAGSVNAQPSIYNGDAPRTGLNGDSTRTGLNGDAPRTGLNGDAEKTVTIENPIKATSIVLLFQTILDIVMVFAVPLIVFFIIYAGFLYVTAQGNSGEIEKAHKALLYALIGGLLILGARVLIEVIQGTVDSIIKK